jgi:hypothetical protein
LTYDVAMNRHVMAMLVALTFATACSKSDQDKSRTTPAAAGNTSAPPILADRIEIPEQLSSPHRAAAAAARDALLAACAGHPIKWDDFEEVSLTTSNAIGYLKDQYDWELMVSIALTYKEGLDQRRGGHRLTFDMGAGSRPGIVTHKSHAIRLCGFDGRATGVASGKPCEPDGGEDCFLDVAALKVLDAARPPAVVQSQRAAPPAWCFAHGFDPPDFWTCASTEKTCKKARSAEKREENGDYRIRSECTRTELLHCFTVDSGKVVCAPDSTSCVRSRKVWTDMNTATACDVATSAMLVASNQPDD